VPRHVSLFWRLFVPNATVLATACVVLMVEPANGRVVALTGGLAALLVVNLVLMRRTFAPLARLSAAMRATDPLRPGQRVPAEGPRSEVTVLAEAFNEMLERLEDERRESGRRALSAQESERRRLAGELHDELGQSLTALALQLNRVGGRVPDGARPEVLAARDTALGLVDETRALARRLRPEGLDALGLAAALTNLVERLSAQTGLPIDRRLARDLPPLDPDAELVLYRVAQESLTNVVRHARASRAELTLATRDADVVLEVRDDGIGVDGHTAGRDGRGVLLMRERAMLVGGELQVGGRPGGPGTVVRLRVPALAGRPHGA
jgi:two-component system sensor histidine kinase UhpB